MHCMKDTHGKFPADRGSGAASPAIPDQATLKSLFIPAAIMDLHSRILPEKLILAATNQPLLDPRSRHRRTLWDTIPTPTLPATGPPTSTADEEMAERTERTVKRAAGQVLLDLSVEQNVRTRWEVRYVPGQAKTETAPLLPAPQYSMSEMGEGYIISEIDTGQVISSVSSPFL